jgi:transcriptional regulator with XRE-family HTH domain
MRAMKPEWAVRVREARRRLGVSQGTLAELVQLSPDTIRAYESARRNPSRRQLKAVIEALRIERGEANRILESAGYASPITNNGMTPDAEFSREEAAAEVEIYPWPAFVNNELAEVVFANTVAQRVWDVDLNTELTNPVERNLLSVASNPRFGGRCTNWEEAVGQLIGTFKGHHRGPEELDAPSPYLSAVLEHFMKGDPQYVARFLALWNTAEPATPKRRWTYRIDWRIEGVGDMRFRCFTSTCNEHEGLVFQDWVPMDAESWESLARLERQFEGAR